MGEVCHSCLKICKSLNTGPVSLLSLETLQLARFMKSMGRLVTLSLSLVLSASALLISHLDRKKSLDNNKSMGFGEASAGSAVGLGSVYHWLQKKKKKSEVGCVYPRLSLSSSFLILWFLFHAGHGMSDLLLCGLSKMQQDHMKARV